jgi:hypothetical protein
MTSPEPTLVDVGPLPHAMTTSLPSGFVEAVHCDDCGDQMAPDPDIRAVTDRDICPVCLEGYL